MNFMFTFPDIGEGIHEGRIIKWYVSKGEGIRSGDAVVKMETDKVVTDIPSPRNGTIVARFGNEGDLVNVGDALVEIAVEGENPAESNLEMKPGEIIPVEEKGFGVVGSLEVAGDAAYLPAGEEGRAVLDVKPGKRKIKVLATPVARAMAKELGVDINTLHGSGPAERIMKVDILRAVQSVSDQHRSLPEADRLTKEDFPRFIVEPLTQIRKAIARNMLRSKQSAAHMTVFEEGEVDKLVDMRKRFNEKITNEGIHLSYLPFILKAVAAALRQYPRLNSRMDSDAGQLTIFQDIHINIAVDTPDGLMVPVIRDVSRKSLTELAGDIFEKTQKAKERSLQLDDFQGGTFTVTNYGSIGGTYGVPVINYPQAAILGIGRIMKRPVVQGNQLAVGHVIPLSLSVDHRIVDGAESARFLRRVADLLAEPDTLLLV